MANKVPTQQAIDHLLANPGTEAQFEAVFGVGSSAQYVQDEAPAVAAPVTPAPSEQATDSASQVVRGVEHGGRGFVNSVTDLLGGASDLVSEGLNEIGVPTVFTDDGRVITREEAENEGINVTGADALSVENVEAPTEIEGQLASGVTQFATGYVLTGGVMSAAGIGGGLTAAGAGFTKGAVADFISFEGEEGRMADLVQSVPELDNPITRYLSTDESDGWLEARLKNVLEGGALGVSAELAVRAIGASARWMRGKQRGAENLDELATEAADANKALTDEVMTPEQARAALNAQQGDELGFGATATDDIIDDVSAPANAPKLADEDAATLVDDLLNPTGDTEAFTSHFNPNKYTPEVQEQLNSLVDLASRQFADQWTGVESQVAIVKAAAKAMEMPEKAIKFLMDQADSAQEMSRAIIMSKMYQSSVATHLGGISKRFDEAVRNGDVAAQDAAKKSAMNLLAMGRQANDAAQQIRQGTARAVSIGQVAQDASWSKALLNDMDELLRNDPIRAMKKFGRLAKADPTGGVAVRGLNRVMTRGRKILDMNNEYWINMILSSPRTHLVNVTSNAIEMGLLPAEEALGAIARNPFSAQQWKTASEAVDTYAGMFHFATDSFRKAKDAFLEDRNILDPEHFVRDDAVSGAIPGKVGKAVGIPTRLLRAEDEFFKQINFRARLYRDGLAKSRQQGITSKDLQVEYASRFVDDQVDTVTGHALVKGKDATFQAQRALEYAEEATFTDSLKTGTLGHGIQSLVGSQPYLRMIMPFVRTPTNLLRHMLKRFPGTQFLYRHEREAFMGMHGAAEQHKTIGKFITGTTITGTGMMLAANGLITGGGPEDPRLRALWLEDHQPYSLRIGDTWLDIRRLDPRLAIFGFIGEASEIGMWGDNREESVDIVGGIAMSISRQMLDRSYFQGLADAMEAVTSQNDSAAKRVLYQRIGSYVPYSALLKTVNPDQEMKDVRNLIDAAKANIPMLSGDVEPLRSPLTGEPLERSHDLLSQYTPFRTMDEVGVTVASLLVEYGVGMQTIRDKRPGTRIKYSNYVNPETGQTALDYMREQMGSPASEGGETLVEALGALMATDGFQQADAQWRQSGAPGVTPLPKLMVQEIIDAYRQIAYGKTLEAYPDLAQDILAEKGNNQSGLEIFGLSLQ